MREGRNAKDANYRLIVDIPYLRRPEHQSVLSLTPDYLPMMEEVVRYVREAPSALPIEKTKLERVQTFMNKNPWDEQKQRMVQRCFYMVFKEYDRRRGTSFRETFPEMAGFWGHCKTLALG